MPERQQEKLLANLDKVKVPFNLPKKRKSSLLWVGSHDLFITPSFVGCRFVPPNILPPIMKICQKISTGWRRQDWYRRVQTTFQQEVKVILQKLSFSVLILFLQLWCKINGVQVKTHDQGNGQSIIKHKKYGKKCFCKSSDPWRSFSLCKIHFDYIYVIQNNKETIKLWFKLANKQEIIWYGKYWKGKIAIWTE